VKRSPDWHWAEISSVVLMLAVTVWLIFEVVIT